MILILGIFPFFKNPIKIRNYCSIFFLFEIVLLFLNIAFANTKDESILHPYFVFGNSEIFLLLLSSFIFLLFLFFSKSFIKYAKKIFYLGLVLTFALLSLFVVSNNIIISLVCMFWLIFAVFFISNISVYKNSSKVEAKKICTIELICFFVAVAFISFDFLRYFAINNISPEYSDISKYLVHIDDKAIVISFIGFLILIFKNFGFLNIIEYYNNKYSSRTFYVSSIASYCESIVGLSLLLKVYFAFDYIFYQYQVPIVILLLFNLIYHTILSFRGDNLSKIANSIFIVGITSGLFSIFSYSKIGISLSFSYFVIAIISYLSLQFIFSVLEDKFKTKNLSEFKRIGNKSRSLQFFVLFLLLNFAKLPVCANFFYFLALFMMVNSIEYDYALLKITPYMILLCTFLVGVCIYNIISKILIEPVELAKDDSGILFNQKVVLLVLIVFMFIMLISINNFTLNIDFGYNVGNM